MSSFRATLAGLAGTILLATALPSQALLEDQNHFAVDKSVSPCLLRLEPQRDALNVTFTGPTQIVLDSTYEFIAGSGVKISFDDGTELSLSGASTSSRRATATIPAEQIDRFMHNKRVKIGGDSSRGALYRRIKLQDFAAAYAEFRGCAAP